VVGADHEVVAVDGPEDGIDGPADAPGVPHDGVEHRLVVCRRGRDRLQDLRRRRLLRQRLGEIAIPRLQLLEQPDILDRDYRLVGEGLQQLYLSFRERSRMSPTDNDRANHHPVAEHWDRQGRTVASGLGDVLQTVFLVKQDVGRVNDSALKNRPAGVTRPRRARGEGAP
jgi:hypothetical protein